MPASISRFGDQKLPANQPSIARGEGFELVEIQEHRFAAHKRNLVACFAGMPTRLKPFPCNGTNVGSRQNPVITGFQADLRLFSRRH